VDSRLDSRSSRKLAVLLQQCTFEFIKIVDGGDVMKKVVEGKVVVHDQFSFSKGFHEFCTSKMMIFVLYLLGSKD
jgi:hypothetical protein